MITYRAPHYDYWPLGKKGFCRVEMLVQDDSAVCLLIEQPENTGDSIESVFHLLALDILAGHEIDPSKVRWFEQRQPDQYFEIETVWDAEKKKYELMHWKKVGKDQIPEKILKDSHED